MACECLSHLQSIVHKQKAHLGSTDPPQPAAHSASGMGSSAELTGPGRHTGGMLIRHQEYEAGPVRLDSHRPPLAGTLSSARSAAHLRRSAPVLLPADSPPRRKVARQSRTVAVGGATAPVTPKRPAASRRAEESRKSRNEKRIVIAGKRVRKVAPKRRDFFNTVGTPSAYRPRSPLTHGPPLASTGRRVLHSPEQRAYGSWLSEPAAGADRTPAGDSGSRAADGARGAEESPAGRSVRQTDRERTPVRPTHRERTSVRPTDRDRTQRRQENGLGAAASAPALVWPAGARGTPPADPAPPTDHRRRVVVVEPPTQYPRDTWSRIFPGIDAEERTTSPRGPQAAAAQGEPGKSPVQTEPSAAAANGAETKVNGAEAESKVPTAEVAGKEAQEGKPSKTDKGGDKEGAGKTPKPNATGARKKTKQTKPKSGSAADQRGKPTALSNGCGSLTWRGARPEGSGPAAGRAASRSPTKACPGRARSGTEPPREERRPRTRSYDRAQVRRFMAERRAALRRSREQQEEERNQQRQARRQQLEKLSAVCQQQIKGARRRGPQGGRTDRDWQPLELDDDEEDEPDQQTTVLRRASAGVALDISLTGRRSRPAARHAAAELGQFAGHEAFRFGGSRGRRALLQRLADELGPLVRQEQSQSLTALNGSGARQGEDERDSERDAERDIQRDMERDAERDPERGQSTPTRSRSRSGERGESPTDTELDRLLWRRLRPESAERHIRERVELEVSQMRDELTRQLGDGSAESSPVPPRPLADGRLQPAPGAAPVPAGPGTALKEYLEHAGRPGALGGTGDSANVEVRRVSQREQPGQTELQAAFTQTDAPPSPRPPAPLRLPDWSAPLLPPPPPDTDSFVEEARGSADAAESQRSGPEPGDSSITSLHIPSEAFMLPSFKRLRDKCERRPPVSTSEGSLETTAAPRSGPPSAGRSPRSPTTSDGSPPATVRSAAADLRLRLPESSATSSARGDSEPDRQSATAPSSESDAASATAPSSERPARPRSTGDSWVSCRSRPPARLTAAALQTELSSELHYLQSVDESLLALTVAERLSTEARLRRRATGLQTIVQNQKEEHAKALNEAEEKRKKREEEEDKRWQEKRDEYAASTQRVIEAQASAARLSAEAARHLAQASTAAPPIPTIMAPSAADAGVVAASAVAAVQEAMKQASVRAKRCQRDVTDNCF
ncbi:serine/arginine repetitive matrix protein 2-like [Amphibalanus amphitrite]|uniref:serine/arginine repetitive matrix protein 2-like n=1 Tax=Amphibalanus amphitrite TaxID=1232801 RepID=UPI001C90C636|nr:serine/arginine repetitive matrix protein 2-like [Amphibalanus amphitrite]